MNLEYRINFAEQVAGTDYTDRFNARVAEILVDRENASIEDLADAIGQASRDLDGPEEPTIIPMGEMP